MKPQTSSLDRTVVGIRVRWPFRKLYVEGADFIENHPFEICGLLVSMLIVGVTFIQLGYVDELRRELASLVRFLY
jgi:hypothetical protein